MPQIPSTEFRALPLRVHTLLADVPLHDVWAVDLPRVREGITLEEFNPFANSNRLSERFPPAARALLQVRLFLGRIFRLEVRPKDAGSVSFATRLSLEDRARSSVAPGTRDGLFRIVYRFENEQLLELQNRTAQAALLSMLMETEAGYRFYLAIYVTKSAWITPLYMALIDPFREWIVYPAILSSIRATWPQPTNQLNYSTALSGNGHPSRSTSSRTLMRLNGHLRRTRRRQNGGK